MNAPGFCEQINYLLTAESNLSGNNEAISITDELIKSVICNLTENGGIISERAFPTSLCKRISRIVKNSDFEVCFAPSLGYSGSEQLGTLLITRRTPIHSASSSEQTSSSYKSEE